MTGSNLEILEKYLLQDKGQQNTDSPYPATLGGRSMRGLSVVRLGLGQWTQWGDLVPEAVAVDQVWELTG